MAEAPKSSTPPSKEEELLALLAIANRDIEGDDQHDVSEESLKRARILEQQRVNGLRKAMNDKEGRIFLRWILAISRTNMISFDGSSRTYFNEGMRNVGLQVQAEMVRHCPDQFIQLLREGNNAS